jgi:perosamine synthetase
MNRIFISEPSLLGNEKKYVDDCLDSNWISSNGKYITLFEKEFANYCGVRHAIATNNGTTALHLALVGLGLKSGDEVLIPTVTFIATANAVTYCGAKPVLLDVLPNSLNIDPNEIGKKINSNTVGIIAVHLYGHPAKMNEVNDMAKKFGLWVLEDAAESHGATYFDKKVGGLANAATFSFYGNKIITTGEGGVVTTNDDELAKKLRLYRGQGMDTNKRYWFPVIGYNYRMTNIQAAIGLGQLENIDFIQKRRYEISNKYFELLQEIEEVELPSKEFSTNTVCWIFNIFLRNKSLIYRDEVMLLMDRLGIETRPVFYPMHVLPPYRSSQKFPVSDSWTHRGISLPTHCNLTDDDQVRVVSALLKAMAEIN